MQSLLHCRLLTCTPVLLLAFCLHRLLRAGLTPFHCEEAGHIHRIVDCELSFWVGEAAKLVWLGISR